MKQIIRRGVFETNSSSTHSLTLGILTPEQKKKDYKFSGIISLKPQHFGYGDIVAPMPDTNHFPDMDEICGDCEYLRSENTDYGDYTEYECGNPAIERYCHYDQCQRYKDSQQKIMDDLIEKQTPDTRACALFACIVCTAGKPAELLYNYFNTLFAICEEVYYRNAKMEPQTNTVDYWKGAIYHGNLGDYNSSCWMEEHGEFPDGFLTLLLATDALKLKEYLFGVGAYAGGDRCG